MRTLFPYQQKVLDWARTQTNPALFCEMRTGKTIITIRLINVWRSKRVLVVAPLSVLASWEDELEKEEERSVSRIPEDKARWTLLNYEKLRSKKTELEGYDVVALDESTRARNPQAKTTKLCLAGFRDAKHRLILSGLPAPEGLQDYCTQFLFLTGAFCGCTNFWAFRNRYFYQEKYSYEWRPRLDRVGHVKAEIQRNAYVLSRKDAGSGERKIYEKRTVALNAAQEKLIKSIQNGFELRPAETTNWTVVCSSWLARVAGGHGSEWAVVNRAKAQELVALLQTELNREQVVVFFRFNKEIELCSSELSQAGISSRTMTGDTPPADRKELIYDFRRGAFSTFLVQLKVGKFGLDLSSADTAIYYSNGYSLEDREQSEDRIVHPSKKKPLLYIDLVSENSIDEDVLDALRQKKVQSAFFLRTVLDKFLKRRGLHARPA